MKGNRIDNFDLDLYRSYEEEMNHNDSMYADYLAEIIYEESLIKEHSIEYDKFKNIDNTDLPF